MNDTIDSSELSVPDKVRAPLILALPVIFYAAGTAVLILAFRHAWPAIGYVMKGVAVVFGLAYIPAGTMFALKDLALSRRIGTTSDPAFHNEVFRQYWKVFKPDIPFVASRRWFVRLYYLGFLYAAVVLLLTVFNWSGII